MNLSGFNDLTLNLEILAEEAAEIIQIKSKIVRFGLDDYHPKNGIVNRAKLEEEIGHFLAMVEILQIGGVINSLAVEAGKQAKFKKLPKWYRLDANTKEEGK